MISAMLHAVLLLVLQLCTIISKKFIQISWHSLSYIAGSCIASGQYGSFHVSGGLRDPKKVFGKVYMQMTAFQHGSSCELSDYETVKKLGHMNCMHVVSLQGV